MRAAAAFFVLAASLAGCATPDGPVTAKGNLDVAAAAAAEWAGDAQLFAVWGMEADNLTDRLDAELADANAGERKGRAGDFALMGANDADPGDGRAPRWLYVYRSEARNARYEVVVESGVVVATLENKVTEVLAPLTPATWIIDSDAAAEIAAASNASYGSIRGRTDVVATSGLASFVPHYPHPIWFLGYEWLGAGKDGAVMVDATNGTVLDAAVLADPRWAVVFPAEMGVAAGLATVANPTDTGSFAVQRRHQVLALAVTSRSGALPMQELRVVVTPPDGVSTWLNHTVLPGFDSVTYAVLKSVGEGKYAYTIELLNGTIPAAAANWEFSWCTEGLVAPDGPFGGGPVACEYRNG